MSRHLSDEQLSELAAGRAAGAGAASGAAASHLQRCRTCQKRATDLRAVRHALGVLPPPDVPPDVFAGISARITGGAGAARSSRQARTHGGPLATLRQWTRRLEPRHLGMAAVVALVGGVASVVLQGSHGAGTAPTNTASDTALGARPTAVTPSTAVTDPATAQPHSRAAVLIETSPAPLVVALGRNYHHATLTEGVNGLLAAIAHPSPSTQDGATTHGAPDVLPTDPCLHALGTRLGNDPADSLMLVAVEAARYDTRPATVLVLVDPMTEGRGVALVLAGRCTSEQPQVLDQVSLTP